MRLFAFLFMLVSLRNTLHPASMGKIVGKNELYSFGNATNLNEGKILSSKTEECCWVESVTHWYHFLVISLSKKYGWFSTGFHFYKHIICVVNQKVHILNWTVESAYIDINWRVHDIYIHTYTYTYIYIYIYMYMYIYLYIYV